MLYKKGIENRSFRGVNARAGINDLCCEAGENGQPSLADIVLRVRSDVTVVCEDAFRLQPGQRRRDRPEDLRAVGPIDTAVRPGPQIL